MIFALSELGLIEKLLIPTKLMPGQHDLHEPENEFPDFYKTLIQIKGEQPKCLSRFPAIRFSRTGSVQGLVCESESLGQLQLQHIYMDNNYDQSG